MFEKTIIMHTHQSTIITEFIVTKIVEQLQIPKNRLLLPADYYDKVLVIDQNYKYIGLLGKIGNNFIIINKNNLKQDIKTYLDCIVVDNFDYHFITKQFILDILTNYDITTKNNELLDFDDNYIAIAKINNNMGKQLYAHTSEDILLQIDFALPYKIHFSEKGFLLRDNLNYLKNYKHIDFVYDFDMVIKPEIGLSFWYYNLFIDFNNFIKLFRELYSFALSLKVSD